jgi:hypothetical protein
MPAPPMSLPCEIIPSIPLSARQAANYAIDREGICKSLLIPMLQGVVLVLATFFVLLNLLVDILHSLIDPRIRRT